jgi:dihydrodipicolinate synthase/N-acetylneuraminate lyase
MLTREIMDGLYVLVVTPFDDAFRFDEEGYRDSVRKLVALGRDHAGAVAMQHECNRILQQAILPLYYEGFNDTALTKATLEASGMFKAGPPRWPTLAVPKERSRLRGTLEREFPYILAQAAEAR